MRVVRASRLMVEVVGVVVAFVVDGESVAVRVVICDARVARVGRIGVEELVAEAGERPSPLSKAVMRSEMVANELMVDGCGGAPLGPDVADFSENNPAVLGLRLVDSFSDRTASAGVFSPLAGPYSPFSIWLSSSTPS